MFYMKFEYDPNKSIINKNKHGIDFKETKQLFKDKNLLVLPLNFPDEKRYASIRKMNNKMWTAIITCRNSNIHIISVRHSHKNEEKLYKSD